MRRRTLLGTTLLGTGALAGATLNVGQPAASAHAAAWRTEPVGSPVRNVAVNSSAFGRWSDGREVCYIVVNGGPAQLVAIDAVTAETIAQFPLLGAPGSWATRVAPDGTVWTGCWNGQLFSYTPGDDAAVPVWQPETGQLWSMTIDPSGVVHLGTYPTGTVHSYDPVTGQAHDHGRVMEWADYVRSIAWWDGQLLLGLGGSRAGLVSLDPESGATQEIELPALDDGTDVFTYGMDARRDTLFCWMSPSRRLLLYDLRAERWLGDVGPSSGLTFSEPGARSEVWFVDQSGQLTSYNLIDGETRTVPEPDSMFSARAFSWVDRPGRGWPGQTLMMSDSLGRLWSYNPISGSHDLRESDLEGQPASVQSLALGPDARLYASGYQSGGLSAIEPATGEIAQYPRGTVGQVEGMTTADGRLWMGVYPGGSLLSFDPDEPFDYGTNPAVLASIEHQDRPFAMTRAGRHLVVGTVPDYGHLGGSISAVTLADGTVATQQQPIPEHSVTALTTTVDGEVIGGTSVWGGLGVKPSQTDAAVFGWDPATRQVSWSSRPMPGEGAVTNLTTFSDGSIWGITAGLVFELDPVAHTVVRSIRVRPFDWSSPTHVWVGGRTVELPDGEVYVVVLGDLYHLDRSAASVTLVLAEVKHAVAVEDQLFITRGTELFRVITD